MRSAAFFEKDREGGRGGRRRGGGRDGGGPSRQAKRETYEEEEIGGGHDDRMGEGTNRVEDARRGRRGSGRGRGAGRGGHQAGPINDSGGTKWQYLDPEGETRGPFPSEAMLNWRKAGYFDDNLPVRPVGANEFQRLATVIGVMKRDIGDPTTPRDQRQPRSSRGQRGDAQPEAYGDAVHPAEALAGERDGGRGQRGRGRMDRPGRGGPRRPQQGYEMDEEEYGQRDRRPVRAPQPTANGGLAYPLDVAKRLFTAEAPYGAEEPVWRYIDLSGNVQGPFPANQMLGWYENFHLDKMDLLVCGTERKVSPPDLPNPAIHYQEFGYLLGLVQAGGHFKPLTPKNIEDGTLPTYPAPARGGEPRGERPRRERSDAGRGPRPERMERGEQRDGRAPREPREPRERGERPPRRGRGERGDRRGLPPQDSGYPGGKHASWETPAADGSMESGGWGGGQERQPRQVGGDWNAAAQGSDWNPAAAPGRDAAAAGSEQGGRRRERKPSERRERKPRSAGQRTEGGVQQLQGDGRSRNRRERRNPRKEADEKVEVELTEAEDGFVKLTISPVKPPAARQAPASALGNPNTTSAEDSQAPVEAATANGRPAVGDWSAIQDLTATPQASLASTAAAPAEGPVDTPAVEATPSANPAAEELGPATAASEETQPLLATTEQPPAATAAAEPATQQSLLSDSAVETQPEEGELLAASAGDLAAQPAAKDVEMEVAESVGLLPAAEPAAPEEVKPLLDADALQTEPPEPASEVPSVAATLDAKKEELRAAEHVPAPAVPATEEPATLASHELQDPLADEVPGTEIAPGQTGKTGALGEKEIEETSATAEEAAGTDALKPVSQPEEQASDPPATEAEKDAPVDEPLSSPIVTEADSAAGKPSSEATATAPNADASEEPQTANDNEARETAAAPGKAASNEEATDTTPDLMKVAADAMTSAVGAAKDKTTELVHTAAQAVKSDEPADSQTEAAKPDTDAPEPTEAKAADPVESAKGADPVESAKAADPVETVKEPEDKQAAAGASGEVRSDGPEQAPAPEKKRGGLLSWLS